MIKQQKNQKVKVDLENKEISQVEQRRREILKQKIKGVRAAREEKKKNFYPHPAQEKALKSNKRWILMLTGIQGGKTLTGTYWLANQFQLHPEDNHAIVAPSYKIMQQSTLPTFFQQFPYYRNFYSARNEKISLPGCGEIFIRSADKPISLEGMTLRSGWVDEAGQIGRYAWIILQGRTAIKKGKLLLTTRAYGINWLKKDFYDKAKKGNQDYDVIEFESRENPGFSEKEWERAKREMDPRIFAMMYQGRFTEMVGRVYEQFREEKNVVSEIPWQDINLILGGIDWGYVQPGAIILVGFTKTDKKCYVISEFYKSGWTLDQWALVAKEYQNKFQIPSFFADPSEPMNIQTLREKGIPVIEGKRDLKMGINKVRELIGKNKLFVHKNCKNLIDEFHTYQYIEEKREKKVFKETPEKANDHGLDALRYIIASQEQAKTSTISDFSYKLPLKERLHIEDFIKEPKPSHWLEH